MELSWLTVECPFCSSVNHVFLSADFPAWECWSCFNIQWINEDRDGYDNEDLMFVELLYGQSEKDYG